MNPRNVLHCALNQWKYSQLHAFRAFYFCNVKNFATQNLKEEVVLREKIQLSKPSITKWKRPPFVKNLFLGKLDTELCAFPEILSKEQVAELEETVKSVNALLTENAANSRLQQVPSTLLQDLKDLGLFGRMVPEKYGGLDLTYSACTRLNEVLGLNASLFSSMAAHEFLATQMLLLFGTEDQKAKYLPNLSSGKSIAALCCSEFESGNDLLSMSTCAVQMPDGGIRLHGTKCWVTNAEQADLFVVFAKTKNFVDLDSNGISLFIVERGAEGLEIIPQEKSCLQGCSAAVVHFKEVLVPSSNLIGPSGRGCEMHLKVLEAFRFILHSSSFGALKTLLDSVTERLIHSERTDRSLGDVQLVRQRLSKLCSVIYAMESVSYFTAAIWDSTCNPDISLETVITKVFNSESALFCLREMMNVVGSSTFTGQMQLERLYHDAQALAMFDGSNDIARLLLGLTGLKFVGSTKAESVMQHRNRFFFPKEAFVQHVRKFRLKHDLLKYSQDIAGHLHPSLVYWGNQLEQKLQRFEMAVEEVLEDHGAKVMETQVQPTILANIAIDLYAMAAVLSRASRSYCLGMRNSQHEIVLAGTFCHDANLRILLELNKIFLGMSLNHEGIHLLMGEQVIDNRGYFPEHPLKHNF